MVSNPRIELGFPQSDWVSETEMLQTFTPLQLDGFVALWQLCHPRHTYLCSNHPLPRMNVISRAEALRLFPVGFVVWKRFATGTRLKEKVYFV